MYTGIDVIDSSQVLLDKIIDKNLGYTIIGANGWFGKTIVNILLNCGIPISQIKCVTKKQTQISLLDLKLDSISISDISDLSNSVKNVLINCAGINRHRINTLGTVEFTKQSSNLRSKIYQVLVNKNYEYSIHFSSGASSGSNLKDYYAYQKYLDEKMYGELRNAGHKIGVIKVWSVSGPFVDLNLNYMFSTFLYNQMNNLEIVIQNPNTIRRYMAIEDIYAVAFHLLFSEGTFQINSEGEKVSAIELAKLIGARFSTAETKQYVNNSYFANTNDIEPIYRSLGLKSSNILKQIEYNRKQLEKMYSISGVN